MSGVGPSAGSRPEGAGLKRGRVNPFDDKLLRHAEQIDLRHIGAEVGCNFSVIWNRRLIFPRSLD